MLSKYPLRSASTTSVYPAFTNTHGRGEPRPAHFDPFGVSVLLWREVSLEDGLQDHHHCHLRHAVPKRADPEPDVACRPVWG